MRMKTILYILLFMLLPQGLLAANDTGTDEIKTSTTVLAKSAGDEAYDRKEYANAIAIYEALIEEQGATAALCYNLGNAYFRSNELGKSILNYERALRLAPADNDIRTNLEFAQSRTKDEVMELHDLFFIEWFHALVRIFGIDTWAIIAVAAFIASLAGTVLFLLVRKSSVRRAGLALSITGLVVTLFANIAAWNIYTALQDDTQAIVMKEEATMMSAPSSSTAIMKIHEGRKVTITDDSIGDWKEIELDDGTVGWVKSSDIERI